MKKVFSVLDKIFSRCVDYLFYLAGALVIITLLVIVVDVSLRFTVRGTITWAFEFTGYALIYITFLGVAWLLKYGHHVKMDVLLVSLKPAAQARLNFAASLLLVITCGLLLWYGITTTADSIQSHAMSVKYYSTPKAVLIGIIPISAFLLLIQSLKDVFTSFRSLKPQKIKSINQANA
jgi:C4-dicarboxylate transporter, DctQ subunit